jgi:hypothetical protein
MRLTMFPPSSKSISAYHITLILLLTSPSLTQASSPLIPTPDNAHDNSPECDCDLISGPTPGYFQYHRFYDFRSIPSTPDNDYTIAPPLVTSSEELGTEPFTSAYLNTTTFRDN